MPDEPHSTTAFLIRETYRAAGCFAWNKPKFIRLCAKYNETPVEMGARIGLTFNRLQQRFTTDSFTESEGILLTLLDRTIDSIKSGIPPEDDLLTPHHG
jgi:hypothetical protein